MYQSKMDKVGVLYFEKEAAVEGLLNRRQDARYNRCSLIGETYPGKASMKYWVCDNAKFIKQFVSLPAFNRVFHESVFPGEPARLYYDLDGEGLTQEEGDARTTLIFNEIVSRLALYTTRTPFHENQSPTQTTPTTTTSPLLAETTTSSGEKDAVVRVDSMVFLDGSREGKYSVHVVFPDLWFESPAHIHALMMYPTKIDPLVDVSVYPLNSTAKFLRMPLCRKETSLSYMRVRTFTNGPFADLTSRRPLENIGDILEYGCISSGGLAASKWLDNVESHPNGKHNVRVRFPEDDAIRILGWDVASRLSGGISRHSSTKFIHDRHGLTKSEYDHVMCGIHNVLQYLKVVYGEAHQFTRINIVDRFTWSCHVNPGFWCPYRAQRHPVDDPKNGYHNNTMFIGMVDGRQLYQNCQHAECVGRLYYWPQNFSCLFGRLVDIGDKLRTEILETASSSLEKESNASSSSVAAGKVVRTITS